MYVLLILQSTALFARETTLHFLTEYLKRSES